MTSPKGQSRYPVTDPNEMAICELSGQKFLIAVLRKLGDLQDNRKAVQEFTREI